MQFEYDFKFAVTYLLKKAAPIILGSGFKLYENEGYCIFEDPSDEYFYFYIIPVNFPSLTQHPRFMARITVEDINQSKVEEKLQRAFDQFLQNIFHGDHIIGQLVDRY